MATLKHFKYHIRGEEWTLILMSAKRWESMCKREGEAELIDATGITCTDSRRIWFKAENFSLYHVSHELYHAVHKYMCIGDANLTAEQMEEVFAKYIAEHGESHIKLSKKIYKDMLPWAEKIKKAQP